MLIFARMMIQNLEQTDSNFAPILRHQTHSTNIYSQLKEPYLRNQYERMTH